MRTANETRNVLVLASCQATFQTGLVLIMTVGGLAGHLLATDKALATLPIAAMMLGTMLVLIPASLLMAQIGRRNGFALGTLLGAGGGAGYADFVGEVIEGFAAVDAARPESHSRAISLVIAGGIVAAIAGPQLATLTKDFSVSGPFVASYGSLVVLSLAATALVALLDIPVPVARTDHESARPLSVIVCQPAFLVALSTAAVGWGVMYLAMTPMPLAMVGHRHALSDAAFVLQWRVLGMSVPSFFTGILIARFGPPLVMLAGIALLAGHAIIALSGVEIVHFLSALILLGVGWNFCYIGGTTLLTETYRPAEKAKAQAVNDFVIFGVMVIASLASGWLFEFFGWWGVNLGAMPFLLLTGTMIILFSLARKTNAQLAS